MTETEVFQLIEEELHPGWNAARGYALPEREESPAMRWGTCFESAVIGLAEREQGMKIIHREQAYARGPVKGGGEKYITCHIDGRYDNNSGNYWSCLLHEGKTTSAFAFREKWGEPGTDRVPREYYYQTQHQMICTGAEKVIVSVLVFPETPESWEAEGWETVKNNEGEYFLKNPGLGILGKTPRAWASVLAEMGFFHSYTVPADRELQEMMVSRYKRFWDKYVLPGVPPEPQNYDDIKRLYTDPKSTLIVPENIERLLAEYGQIGEEAGKQKKRQEQIKVKVLDWARKQEGGVIDDESAEALILRNSRGEKAGSFSKNKNGTAVFRA
jgi:predicted phage-related endonuclease